MTELCQQVASWGIDTMLFSEQAFMGVPSCIHLGFLQLFDLEVEFGGLPGGLEKRKKIYTCKIPN